MVRENDCAQNDLKCVKGRKTEIKETLHNSKKFYNVNETYDFISN